jgi:hypothetical protein
MSDFYMGSLLGALVMSIMYEMGLIQWGANQVRRGAKNLGTWHNKRLARQAQSHIEHFALKSDSSKRVDYNR